MSATALQAGLQDPVRDSQHIFRAVMNAMARPGTVHRLATQLEPPSAMPAGSAAIALALCDFETAVWLSPVLAADPSVTAFLRFHTGATIVQDRAAAAFAFLAPGEDLPSLDGFALGTAEYPDRSTTVVVPVDSLVEGSGWTLHGPGIDGHGQLAVTSLPPDMTHRLAANRMLFPRGVDLIFVAGDRIAALPRTTKVQG